jgi:hypothetical protein
MEFTANFWKNKTIKIQKKPLKLTRDFEKKCIENNIFVL